MAPRLNPWYAIGTVLLGVGVVLFATDVTLDQWTVITWGEKPHDHVWSIGLLKACEVMPHNKTNKNTTHCYVTGDTELKKLGLDVEISDLVSLCASLGFLLSLATVITASLVLCTDQYPKLPEIACALGIATVILKEVSIIIYDYTTYEEYVDREKNGKLKFGGTNKKTVMPGFSRYITYFGYFFFNIGMLLVFMMRPKPKEQPEQTTKNGWFA